MRWIAQHGAGEVYEAEAHHTTRMPAEHKHDHSWSPEPDLETWMEQAGFLNHQEFHLALVRCLPAAGAVMRPADRPAAPPPAGTER